MKKIIVLFFIIVLNILLLTGCVIIPSFSISNGDRMTMVVGSSINLNVTNTTGLIGDYHWEASNNCVTVESGLVTAVKEGSVVVMVTFNEYSDSISINVTNGETKPDEIYLDLRCNKKELYVGEQVELDINITPASYLPQVKLEVTNGKDLISIDGNVITANKAGAVIIVAVINNIRSREVFIEIIEEEILEDPYVNIDKDEFYANYTEAKSYQDSYYRTLHGLMSGSIEPQDQSPTIEANRPEANGKLIKNTEMIYSQDGNTYYIINAEGEIVDQVFKGGAYVTLEEVAAYVFAFGEVPANHSDSKKTKPSGSVWGKYLRVNNTKFSGSTSKYPYEPGLPFIDGNGGHLQYYEMDLGTTGTDCDPSYDIREYNNGYSIERGAARIVYSRYDKNGNKIIDIDEKFVFYTYNHYNDFQEYLNYQGGWGDMFGNITGGGTLSSKYDCNPTPYVEVVLKSLAARIVNHDILNNANHLFVNLEEFDKKYI